MFVSDPDLIVIVTGLFAAYAACLAGLVIIGHAVESKEGARCSCPTQR